MRKGQKQTTTFVMVRFQDTPPGHRHPHRPPPPPFSNPCTHPDRRTSLQEGRRSWTDVSWGSAHITYMVEGMILGGHRPTSLNGGEGPRCWWAVVAGNDVGGGGERRSTMIIVRWYPGSTRLAGKPGPPWCLSLTSSSLMAGST